MADPTQQTGQQGSQGNNPDPGGAQPPPAPPAAPPPGGEGDESWRNSPGALAMRQQIADERSRREALEAKIKQQAEEEERKRLEEKGEYEQLAKRMKAEKEALEASYKAERRQNEFELKMRDTGLSPEVLAFARAIHSLPADGDIGDYVKSLQADYKSIWEGALLRGAEVPPQGGRASGGDPTNWDQVRREAADPSDPIKMAAADKKIMDFLQKENKLPWQ